MRSFPRGHEIVDVVGVYLIQRSLSVNQESGGDVDRIFRLDAVGPNDLARSLGCRPVKSSHDESNRAERTPAPSGVLDRDRRLATNPQLLAAVNGYCIKLAVFGFPTGLAAKEVKIAYTPASAPTRSFCVQLALSVVKASTVTALRNP
jgi:hypothetical protein